MSTDRPFGRKKVGTARNGKAPLLEPNEDDQALVDFIQSAYAQLLVHPFVDNPIRREDKLYLSLKEASYFVVGPNLADMGHLNELPADGAPSGEMTWAGICDLRDVVKPIASFLRVPSPV